MSKDTKIALVTNATEYGGPASVQALTREGFIVYCQDPKFSEDGFRDTFLARFPQTVLIEKVEPETVVQAVIDRYGRIDTLVSNDCGNIAQKELSANDFREALEVLTVTPYRYCAAVIPVMKQGGGGSIILITSGGPLLNPVASRDGNVSIHYQTARHAAHGLVHCFAQMVGQDNIQINAIAPFMFYSQTYFSSEQGENDPAFIDLLERRVPMRRFGNESEFGELVAMLGGGRSKFVSGQVIAFSGGGA